MTEHCIGLGLCNGVEWRIYRVDGHKFRLEIRFEDKLVYRREFASEAEARGERTWPSRTVSLG